MNAIIDLGPELLIDRSQMQTPYVRLLVAAIGKEMVSGLSWMVVNKRVAGLYSLAGQAPSRQRAAVA